MISDRQVTLPPQPEDPRVLDSTAQALNKRIRTRLSSAAAYAGLAGFGVLTYVTVQGVNAFYSQILIIVVTWTIAATGVNVISGLGGYPSLMQGAFYGLGAYGSTIMLDHSVPFWLSVPLSAALAAAVGLVAGIVFSRTRGQYFAIGTLFLGAVFNVVLDNWKSVTGGAYGLSVPASLTTRDAVLAICVVFVLVLCAFRAITRSRLGRRLACIRDDEDLSTHLGVPTVRTKLIGFAVSAAIGGAAGAVFAQFYGSVTPSQFTYQTGFLMFVAVGVGGSGRLFGPLLGSALIEGLPPALNIGSGLTLLVVGVVFVVVTIVLPRGIMGVVDDIYSLFKRLIRRNGT